MSLSERQSGIITSSRSDVGPPLAGSVPSKMQMATAGGHTIISTGYKHSG